MTQKRTQNRLNIVGGSINVWKSPKPYVREEVHPAMISVSFKITCLSNIFRAPTVSVVFSKKNIERICEKTTDKTNCSLRYRNHKSCKILPKFLPTLHFLQESYKFVQESQISQICYNGEHFSQGFDKNFAKIAFLR